MSPLTPQQAAQDDFAAGFRGAALQIAVAIEEAESRLFPGATNTAGNSAGTDRGIWQINSFYHPEVSNAQAFDPAAASRAAYGIYQSSGDTFHQWSTYASGAYKQFLSIAAQAVQGVSSMTQQWFSYPISQGYGQNGETGNDIATPFHSAITALYGGTVVDAGYHPYGGQVEIAANVPGYGALTETIIHLDTVAANLVPGAHVNAGDFLGLSGGENPGYPGALHPAQPQFSSGPHVEVDFERAGRNIDPTAIIAAFRGGEQTLPPATEASTDPCAQYAAFSQQWLACQAAKLAPGVAQSPAGGIVGFIGSLAALPTSIKQGIQSFFERGALVAAGTVLVIIGLLVLFFSGKRTTAILPVGTAGEAEAV